MSQSPTSRLDFSTYDTGEFFDELVDESGKPRRGAELLIEKLESLDFEELKRRQAGAERSLFRLGITFAVYGDTKGKEKIFRRRMGVARARTEAAYPIAQYVHRRHLSRAVDSEG